jgi:hypothetical protein
MKKKKKRREKKMLYARNIASTKQSYCIPIAIVLMILPNTNLVLYPCQPNTLPKNPQKNKINAFHHLLLPYPKGE